MEDFSGVTKLKYDHYLNNSFKWGWTETSMVGCTNWWEISTNPNFSYGANGTFTSGTFSYPGYINGFARIDQVCDEYDDYLTLASPIINCAGQNQLVLSYYSKPTFTSFCSIKYIISILKSNGPLFNIDTIHNNADAFLFNSFDITSIVANDTAVRVYFKLLFYGFPPGYAVVNYNTWCLDEIQVINPQCNILNSMIYSATPSVFCQGDSLELYHDSTAATITFQWYKNGTPIAGANSSNFWASDSGIYYCKMTDTCGYVFSNYLPVIMDLPINPSPFLTFSDTITTYCPTGNVKYVWTPSYPEHYTYQWLLNGDSLPSLYGSMLVNNPGDYTCIVNNTCGSYYSDTISINFLGPPAVIDTISGFPVCYPDSFMLAAQIVPNCTYQWNRGNNPLPADTSFSFTSNQYGTYYCMVSDTGTCHRKSNSITVSNYSYLSVIYANGPTTFCQGNSVTLSGYPGGNFQYQWTRNGINISGATQSTFVATQQGTYQFFVGIDSCNIASPVISVTVPCRPAFGDDGNAIRLAEEALVNFYAESVNKEITINISEPLSGNIEIINISGQIVFQKNLDVNKPEQKLSLGKLNKGLYIAVIKSSAGIINRKIIIN